MPRPVALFGLRPDFLHRFAADTALQPFLNGFLQAPELRVLLLVPADQVTEIFAVVAVFATRNLRPDLLLLPVRHGDALPDQCHLDLRRCRTTTCGDIGIYRPLTCPSTISRQVTVVRFQHLRSSGALLTGHACLSRCARTSDSRLAREDVRRNRAAALIAVRSCAEASRMPERVAGRWGRRCARGWGGCWKSVSAAGSRGDGWRSRRCWSTGRGQGRRCDIVRWWP